MNTKEYCTAVVASADFAAHGTLQIQRAEPLTQANHSAHRRPIGRSWGIGLRPDGQPIQPLVAVMLAAGSFHTQPASRGIRVWQPTPN